MDFQKSSYCKCDVLFKISETMNIPLSGLIEI
jgi:hypothetical protein